MKENDKQPKLNTGATYRIVIAGHLDELAVGWPDGLQVVNEHDVHGKPITTISGEVKDQAMLHGVLARIRDLGLTLAGLERIE
jgi:hypothetical protein